MNKAAWRKFWFQVHKWIALVLLVLLVPISVSGAALVWHDALDAAINPGRYAVTKGTPQPLAALGAVASKAAQPGERLASIRFEHDGPAVATLVAPGNGPPKRTSLWIDPVSGRVLDRAGANEGIVRVLHGLHGSLLMPGIGRPLVGWLGVAMLLSSLTGIWLWWPLTGRPVRGLRWRRRNSTNANLHYTAGFWIALPLAMLSFTGVWISFPSVFGPLVGEKAPDPGERMRRLGAMPLVAPSTGVALAAAAASSIVHGEITSISWPTDRTPQWQVAIQGGAAEPVTVKVDDMTSTALPPNRPGGRPVARSIRALHDGTGMGPVWQAITFIGGLVPALLAYTGVAMWLRDRRRRSGAA